MTRIYPDKLKVAKVVPILKKEDKLQLKIIEQFLFYL